MTFMNYRPWEKRRCKNCIFFIDPEKCKDIIKFGEGYCKYITIRKAVDPDLIYCDYYKKREDNE